MTLKCGSIVVSLREKGMSLEVLGARCGKKRGKERYPKREICSLMLFEVSKAETRCGKGNRSESTARKLLCDFLFCATQTGR